MVRLLEHLNVLKAPLNAIEQIATKQANEWCSDDPRFDLVIRALDGSRIAPALHLMGDMGSWPIPATGIFHTQIEIMLQREDLAARATLDRILYELYELESSHIWDLETDLWP